MIATSASDHTVYEVILVMQRLWGDKLLCKACNSLPEMRYDVVPPVKLQEPLVKPGCRFRSRLGGEEGAGLMPKRQNVCWMLGDRRAVWSIVKAHFVGSESLLFHS